MEDSMSGVALAMLGAVSQGVLWGLMVLAQGLIWGIMAIGVYITFRILDIADLTVDGSFALGGCVCAAMIANKGMNPVLAIFIALLAVLFAVAICVVCVIFSDFIAAFGVLLIGGKLLLRGLVSFPYSLSGALMITGCGLLGIGCAILLYLLGIYLCKWTGMLLVMLARKIAGKRGKNHEKNK
mgnify:CR=1 FL=1